MHQPYTRVIPHSKDAIVFIHGFIGTPDHFKQFYLYVPETWSIYNLLLDGHGGSVDQFAKTSMNKWQQQVKKTIDDIKNHHQMVYLVGHSMGTLLEIQYTLLNPSKIAGLFLLAVPLHVHITPLAVFNALGTIFKFNDKNNLQLQAAKAMYSVDPDARVWKYIPWIPRYIELLKLCKWTRNMIDHLHTDTIVIQSKKDELVQFCSHEYFKTNNQVELIVLNQSTHYYYQKSDEELMYQKFKQFIFSNE